MSMPCVSAEILIGRVQMLPRAAYIRYITSILKLQFKLNLCHKVTEFLKTFVKIFRLQWQRYDGYNNDISHVIKFQ